MYVCMYECVYECVYECMHVTYVSNYSDEVHRNDVEDVYDEVLQLVGKNDVISAAEQDIREMIEQYSRHMIEVTLPSGVASVLLGTLSYMHTYIHTCMA